MAHPSEDDLGLLALGETLPGAAQHLAACPACAAEVEALRETVRAARAGGPGLLEAPPARVWDRISDELGLAPPPAVPVQRRRVRLLVSAGLALVGVLAVGVVGARLLSGSDPRAPLVALGGTRGSGEVVLHSQRSGWELEVETDGLPAPDGFYEVWLLEPGTTRMVALGVLDERGTARLPVPEGLQLGDRPVVDISIEPDDGNPAHSTASVLRADLPA